MLTQLGLFGNDKNVTPKLDNRPGQMMLFGSADILQFGLTAHPLAKLTDSTQMALISEPATPGTLFPQLQPARLFED